ncbi:MAG: hypothetical protein EON86_00335 [Brevundimonas sp.]|nr:MAG: hypothetical protein EON86_00335 [Brevundimonas sp.]
MERPIMTYLERRGAMYRFRRVIPEELRPFFSTRTGKPRTEFSESLGTKDRREAERRCLERARETTAELDEARKRFKGGEPSRPMIAATPMRAMTLGEIGAMEAAGADNAEAHFAWEEREAARQKLLKGARENDDIVALALRDIAAEDLLEPEWGQRQRQADREASWKAGEAEVVRDWATSRGLKTLPTYPALPELFQSYARAARLEPATVKRWEPVIAHLVAFVRHDDASKLTFTNVREWRDRLLGEQSAGEPVRGPRTVRETYLAALKAVLSDAVQNGELTENVAANVKVRVPKQVRLRQPGFTSEECKTILRATLEAQPVALSPTHALARRWVPWVCAYTGARVNEITQLRAEDVHEEDGIWSIKITPDAGSVKTKEARTVPLHSHLIEQGFVRVALERKSGPLFYNPAAGRGGSSKNPHYKKVGERLAAWVRSLGVDDPNVQPNHAWRHLFTFNARIAGMDPEAREAIPGHAPATTGRSYGGLKPLVFLWREIEKLPRFDIA